MPTSLSITPASNLTDLPAVPDGIDAGLADLLSRMREAVQVLRANRGDPLDAAITWRALIANGMARMQFNVATGGVTSIIPAPAPGTEPDLTPPPTVTGLAVFAGLSKIIVQWDAAVYSQGHGNRQTNIYAVQRDVGSVLPLPTFADAVLVTSSPQAGTIIDISSNPNTKWYVWAKYETVDGVESTAPAGGTNGVQGTTGQDVTSLLDALTRAAFDPASPYDVLALRADLFTICPTVNYYQTTTPGSPTTGQLWLNPSTGITQRWTGTAWVAFAVNPPFFVTTVPITTAGVTAPPGVYMTAAFIQAGTITNAMIGNAVIDNAKVSDLSASKITAGSIAVGEYIQSSGFVSGSTGWRISGAGDMELSFLWVRDRLQVGQITEGAVTNTSFHTGATYSGSWPYSGTNTMYAYTATGDGFLIVAGSVDFLAQQFAAGVVAVEVRLDLSIEHVGVGTVSVQSFHLWLPVMMTASLLIGPYSLVRSPVAFTLATALGDVVQGDQYKINVQFSSMVSRDSTGAVLAAGGSAVFVASVDASVIEMMA